LGSIYFRLDSRELLLDLSLSVLNSDFILGAASLEFINLSLSLGCLFHSSLNLFHSGVSFLLLVSEFNLLFSSVFA
jgi:hypothetical protein